MIFDFSLVKAEKLAKYHDLSQFDCEDEDINDFVKNHPSQMGGMKRSFVY